MQEGASGCSKVQGVAIRCKTARGCRKLQKVAGRCKRLQNHLRVIFKISVTHQQLTHKRLASLKIIVPAWPDQ